MKLSRTTLDLFHRWLGLAIEPRLILALPGLWRYFQNWTAFRRQQGDMPVLWRDTFPKLDDRLQKTPFDPHYFFQGNWLARRLAKSSPEQHVDIGSSVLTIGVISAYTRTIFLDFRPLEAQQAGLVSVAGDIARLPFPSSSLASVSCLHVIEHIGLGRYGDPIDVHGAQRAARELERVIAEGGRLFLSTPIGRERVCFDAHRVFSVSTILAMFSGLRLVEFSFVDDDGKLHSSVPPSDVTQMEYGCGLFEFAK